MHVRRLGVVPVVTAIAVVAVLGLSACTSSTEAGSTTSVLGLGTTLTSATTTASPARTTAGSVGAVDSASPSASASTAAATSGDTAAGPTTAGLASAPTIPSDPAPAAGGVGVAPEAGTSGLTATAATTAPAPTDAAPPPASGADAQGGDTVTPEVLDVCAALPVATVSRDTGVAYTQQFPSSAAGIDECDYDNDDSTVAGLSVSVLDDADGEVWSTVHQAGVTDISGLGDKAMWDNQNSLYAEKGTHLVQVDGDSLTQDQARTLAAIIVAALP